MSSISNKSARAAAALLFALGCAGRAQAAPRSVERREPVVQGVDGGYERFDGDWTFAVGLGAEASLSRDAAMASARLSAHYLWTAGAYVEYADGFGRDRDAARRVLSLGVDLRPLFLPRFGLDLERGPEAWDLLLDSFSLRCGAFFSETGRRDFGEERGFEAGLGLGLPIFAGASGPWLEAGAKLRVVDDDDVESLVSLRLAYHFITSL